jgi:hypothetical protein
MPESRNPFKCKGFKGGVKQSGRQILGQPLTPGMPAAKKAGIGGCFGGFAAVSDAAAETAAGLPAEETSRGKTDRRPLDSWPAG